MNSFEEILGAAMFARDKRIYDESSLRIDEFILQVQVVEVCQTFEYSAVASERKHTHERCLARGLVCRWSLLFVQGILSGIDFGRRSYRVSFRKGGFPAWLRPSISQLDCERVKLSSFSNFMMFCNVINDKHCLCKEGTYT